MNNNLKRLNAIQEWEQALIREERLIGNDLNTEKWSFKLTRGNPIPMFFINPKKEYFTEALCATVDAEGLIDIDDDQGYKEEAINEIKKILTDWIAGGKVAIKPKTPDLFDDKEK